jgi:hypothetical protein
VFRQLINPTKDGWPKQIWIKAVQIAQDEIAIDHTCQLSLRLFHDRALRSKNGNASLVISVSNRIGKTTRSRVR